MSRPLIISSLLILYSLLPAAAQDKTFSKTRLQVSLGPGRGFHWNDSFLWGTGYVVYTPAVQEHAGRVDWHLAVLRDLDRYHSVLLGIGNTRYGFREKGTFIDDTFTEGMYEEEFRVPYASLFVGHRWSFSNAAAKPFIENSIWSEWALKRMYGQFAGRRDAGLAYRLAAGMIWSASPGISIHTSAFFKTSILRFNPVFFDEYYSPYAYGIEAGLSWTL